MLLLLIYFHLFIFGVIFVSFLSCKPLVSIINDEYEIIINTQNNGIIAIEVDGNLFYEENSGVLYSEKNYAKIRVPSIELNKAKEYKVIFRETIDRKAYWSQFNEEQTEVFTFKSLTKEDNINIYHVGDVHNLFSICESTASYFGNNVDLFIINGDISEVECEANYLKVCEFAGNISKGEIPVIFSRGNHDTRGKLSERYTDFLPSDGKKTYYSFKTGKLWGVVLDCGEDKVDNTEVYNGTNKFREFRKRQLEYLKTLKSDGEVCFAISHICPSKTADNIESEFNIEQDIYKKWNKELDRLGIKFMITAHLHKAFIVPKNSEESTIPHNYPIIVGTECHFCEDDDVWGTALTLKGNMLEIKFTDKHHKVKGTHNLNLSTGEIL